MIPLMATVLVPVLICDKLEQRCVDERVHD